VLFERICRKNGIKQLLTKPYSPTTIGKVERWHQTLQTNFLNDVGPFATIEEAQAAVDGWRHEYNTERPHQSLDMATPASRFRPSPSQEGDALGLWAPADLEPLTSPTPALEAATVATEPASWPDAVEVDRVVPPSGNMWVGGQQFWLSPARAGQTVTLWIDTTTVHLSVGGWRIKTMPSRLSEVDLARLRRADGHPAGPPPAGPSPGVLAASRCVEVDRLVNGIGGITLLNRLILVGSPLAGQRARIRLDGHLMHVLTQDGVLWRTLPCPIPPGQRHRLQGVRLAGPAPLPEVTVTVQRRVSSRGGIQVARQRIHAGMIHAGKTATVICENNHFRVVIDGDTAAVVPRTTSHEIGRYKANATDKRTQRAPQGR
jgi:Integrase core domain